MRAASAGHREANKPKKIFSCGPLRVLVLYFFSLRIPSSWAHPSAASTTVSGVQPIEAEKSASRKRGAPGEEEDHDAARKLLHKLRWVTLGYHYDWTAKIYDPNHRTAFPEDLAELSSLFAAAVHVRPFRAEACIVNFYHLDSTLAGHSDFSELNYEMPIISFSFGHEAIFLIGGLTRDEEPLAIHVHSGDVVVMSGDCRLSYHGVPCILDDIAPHLTSPLAATSPLFAEQKRPKPKTAHHSSTPPIESYQTAASGASVASRIQPAIPGSEASAAGCQGCPCSCVCDEHFAHVAAYLADSRININVRQVLFQDGTGDEQLASRAPAPP
eukprot:m.699096 g.699096  ORF g.699096 m.699096 type:complete len:328 (-) comp58688_c0_seq48:217-1200(-)